MQLRKVTERVRPETQKVDERDPVLQLRKVTERARPEIQKVDEKDSLLQLRKVTERAMPEIPKVDERDSLLEQIRKKVTYQFYYYLTLHSKFMCSILLVVKYFAELKTPTLFSSHSI